MTHKKIQHTYATCHQTWS